MEYWFTYMKNNLNDICRWYMCPSSKGWTGYKRELDRFIPCTDGTFNEVLRWMCLQNQYYKGGVFIETLNKDL